MRVALEVRVAEDVRVVLAVLAVERPTALVERVLVEVVEPEVRVVLAVVLVVLEGLEVLVVLAAPDVLVVAPDVLVVLPNVLRAVAVVAVRAEVRAPSAGAAARALVRVVVVLRISRALVIPLLRRVKERSGCAVAYSLRATFRCMSW